MTSLCSSRTRGTGVFQLGGTTGLFVILALASVCTAQSESGWTGNFVKNPGFEEDFVNVNGEGHVLSFKGDWYYNQRDLVPDYWALKGSWTWNEATPRSGRHTLKLAAGASASQRYQRAMYQHGGSAWSGGQTTPIPMPDDEKAKFAQPWRASVWCRGGGTIKLGTATATAQPGNAWQQLKVELPTDKVGAPNVPVTVTLEGPGEFDDVAVQEKLTPAPNLIPNASFESADAAGHPVGWSMQKKFRAIGPTYYVWTDWNHCFRPNQGAVVVDPLVAHTGKQSLRFDVHPGDEKLVESDLIEIKQDKPRAIEVGVYVRADRVKLIDVRCVDQDGIYMPGYRPRQPEYRQGGSFTFGNGTFEWRYVRKFFGVTGNRPLRGFRVRLCARGMNGHILDDAGTRPYGMQVGTVWWDDLQVTERTTDVGMLRRRGVKLPPAPAPAATPGALKSGQVDLGQRFFGDNALTYSFVNNGATGSFQLRLTTTLPDAEPVVTTSPAVRVAKGANGTLSVPYRIGRLAGDLEKQGRLALEVLSGNKPLGGATYRFNTWPVIVDIDVSRHYNLPNENPVTVSMNLGVADQTLAKVVRLECELFRPSDKKVLGRRSFADLRGTFRQTLQNLPRGAAAAKLHASQGSKGPEFNLPTPEWTVDRTNLIVTKMDLRNLKVWPHDYPVRDTVLVVRGLDAAGQELFRQQSDPFGRMQQRPKQPAIESVAIREDGAVLVNGEPRFLTGATHQHFRLRHDPSVIAQLGLMGHRLTQGFKNEQMEKMWTDYNLYALQAKPDPSIGGTSPAVTMSDKQKKNFTEWVGRGGMKNIVAINTGGWEATINFDDAATVAKHKATNDWVRKAGKRPIAISTSGAYNAWWLPKLTPYDINHAETEMWGPMDFNVIFTPYMKRARGKPTAWVYLPQLYDNHPFERYRFETYENIVRGSAGVSMIQGIGDPTLNRGLAGELRYLEKPLNSLEKAASVTFDPLVSHKVTRYKGKTYVLTTNAGPIKIGNWTWHTETKQSGAASHEGDSMNQMWVRPGGVRIHGFRGLAMPDLIQKGDKIVQYVWIDPNETPEWVMVAVRGDGRFAHNAVLGKFDFAKFREARGNLLMYSELNHSVWHEVNWVMDDETHARAVKVMGQKWADRIKKGADAGRAKVDKIAYQASHFHSHGKLPATGSWHRIEMDAEKVGLVGKLVDGFAYLAKGGRALWDYSVLERDGEVIRVYCEDTVGIDRALLPNVRINVPGLKEGTPVKVLFEDRTIVAEDGGFVDDFVGTDTYGYEADGVAGDMFGFVKDPDRELPRMIPSGYAYSYGPTAVHIYEIAH